MENDYFDDPEFQELIRNYLDFLSDSLPDFKRDCSEKNYPGIRKFGHNLKGSGGGYGFNDLTEIGGEISKAAREENDDVIDDLVTKFETLLNKKREKYFN